MRVAKACPVAWSVLKASLALAEKDVENERIPASHIIDLARWVIEMQEGKPTVKLDAQVEQQIVLPATLIMAAIAQAQMDTLALDTEREGSPVIESDWVACEGNDSEKRPFAKCSDTPTEGVE
ncbi:MAG: hypothetical protein WC455_29865 [Dehalococcoidia bacterium]|jgi:hypothetical protein